MLVRLQQEANPLQLFCVQSTGLIRGLVDSCKPIDPLKNAPSYCGYPALELSCSNYTSTLSPYVQHTFLDLGQDKLT